MGRKRPKGKIADLSKDIEIGEEEMEKAAAAGSID